MTPGSCQWCVRLSAKVCSKTQRCHLPLSGVGHIEIGGVLWTSILDSYDRFIIQILVIEILMPITDLIFYNSTDFLTENFL